MIKAVQLSRAVVVPRRCFLVLVFLLSVAANLPTAAQDSRTYAADHVVIKFKEAIRTELGNVGEADLLPAIVARLKLPAGAELKEPVVNQLLALKQKAPGQIAPVAFDRFLYLHLPPGLSPEECVRRLKNHPWVEYVEPDGIGTGGLIPNDPDFNSQWHHRNLAKPSASIHTPEMWGISTGSGNILVAVADSGLNTNLTEFAGRVIPGYNFVSGTPNAADDEGHGTAVTGVLCATGNNGIRVAGVNWGCRVMPLKVLDQNNSGLYSWWAQAVDFAVSQGCKVINLSAGGSITDFNLTRAITNAIAHGVIFVTITHNDGSGTIRFPGNLTNCITLGATDERDARCGFSNFGPQIDLVAPGTNIYTVGSSGSLESWWGTSLAAPQASGVAAILAGLLPGLTHEQARNLLCAGADDQVGDATDTPGFDNYYGWGRLNAFNSILLAQTRVDTIKTTNNALTLSWVSPLNASNKQPYQVQCATSLGGGWVTLTDSNSFHYASGRTDWTLPGAVTNNPQRFYRVSVRSF